MSVKYAFVGAVSSSGFSVRARITGTTGALTYSVNADLSGATTTSTIPVAGNIVAFTITGLTANTRYYWAVIDTGVTDLTYLGRVQTHPVIGSQASFRFAASSCAGLDSSYPGQVVSNGVSNHGVFSTINEYDPLFFSHIGDLHYRNISTNDEAGFRTAFLDVATYNDTLGATAKQGVLYRSRQWVYGWDDHDFGANDCDSTSASRSAANKVYREIVPSYSLPTGLGVYQSWQVGRVLFILNDTRSFRDPDSTAQSPSKTMLGIPQKEWMRNILATSTAKFFVWLMPTPWNGYSNDTWAGFLDERAEMAAMFVSTGWANRMVMITGDRHALAIDTGTGNPTVAKFPTYMFGSLDCEGPGEDDTQYNLGMLTGMNQWGQCEIVDSGTQISFTGNAMNGTSVWRTFTFAINVALDVDPLPVPSDAHQDPSVTWFACDLVSGVIIDELPDIKGTISRTLGAYTSTSLTVPMIPSGAGYRRNILASTEPAQVLLVAVVNGRPTWGGIVLTRSGGTDALLTLGAVTLEGYLVRRYVRGLTGYTQVDQSSVLARAILQSAGPVTGVGGGIGLLVDAPASGVLRDQAEILTSDHKTVYDCMTALMDLDGGPEWTVDLEWTSTAQQAVAKIVRVRSRIGAAQTSPVAVFDSQGNCNATYTFREDWTDGKGANSVTAYSSGQENAQPVSEEWLDTASLALGRPLYEHRFQPDTNVTDTSILDAYASAELDLVKTGLRAWDITTRWDTDPRLNVDWVLGDDVAWNLTGHRHPDGVQGIGRVIGWEIDIQTGTMQLTMQEAQ